MTPSKMVFEGRASLSVNGIAVGQLPAASSVRPVLIDHWTRRSITVPISALRTGTNTFTVGFAGDVRIDRLQVELAR